MELIHHLAELTLHQRVWRCLYQPWLHSLNCCKVPVWYWSGFVKCRNDAVGLLLKSLMCWWSQRPSWGQQQLCQHQHQHSMWKVDLSFLVEKEFVHCNKLLWGVWRQTNSNNQGQQFVMVCRVPAGPICCQYSRLPRRIGPVSISLFSRDPAVNNYYFIM